MPRRFAILCLTGLIATGPAVAQTRIIAQANGWSAFGGTTEGGAATCGLETRDPNTGRHFLLQHLAGQDQPILRLARPNWNLGASTTRPVRIVIDNRRYFAMTTTGAGREMSSPLTLDGPNGFEPAFRLGSLMRVEFPTGQDTPWNLSLTGTNTVMGAFVGCMRMMVIQPGEAPPPPQQQPIQPPPPSEPPPLGPPLEEPLRPPVEPPQPVPPLVIPTPAPPLAPPPAEAPRHGLPTDKPLPPPAPAPAGKPEAPAKPG